MYKKHKKVVKYHKIYILQIYGYLALIPFFFAYLALKESYILEDIIIFTLGLIFVLVLLFVNHLEPVVRVTEHKVILYNKFHNRPTTLRIKNFNSYQIINKRRINVTFGRDKFEIKLNKRDMEKFIKFLEGID